MVFFSELNFTECSEWEDSGVNFSFIFNRSQIFWMEPDFSLTNRSVYLIQDDL